MSSAGITHVYTTFGQAQGKGQAQGACAMVLREMRQWLHTLLTLNGSPRGVAGGFALANQVF